MSSRGEGDKFDLFRQARARDYGALMLASAKRRAAIPAGALLGGVALSAWLSACSGSAPVDPGGSSPAGAAGSGGATAGGAGAGTNSIVGGTPGTGGGLAAGGGGMPSTLAGAGGVAGSANAGSANAGSANAGSANAGTGGGPSEPVTCPSSKLTAGDSDKTINVGGSSRNYVLHVPAAYGGDKPVPLLIDFHPLGGTGGGQRSQSRYPMQTDPEGVIIAFPSGKQGPSGGAWDVGPCCVADVDDVALAKALVTEISNSACIDPKRVYAAGF